MLGPRLPFVLFALAMLGCTARAQSAPKGYRIVRELPHDTAAYTQGLIWRPGDTLLESTGLFGQSRLRKVVARTGAAVATIALPDDRFGEGIAILDNRLFQLTWQSGVAYVYDPVTLALSDSIRYPGEGWGLASDGRSLIMSDGSDSLRVIDPRTFAVERVVKVRYPSGAPVAQLNELEYFKGELFANVYQSDWILRIDPTSGVVRQVLDLGRLLPSHNAAATDENVLNGIAVDDSTGHLWVTGKRWPRLFVLELLPQP
ncbi:MAG: glutaminyl-peptide cyclotransferase [Gemmatimonadetes bacterium]|nr:glutaminyl-peptide cyclotransferase [Gemmatimonadota bacterium]